MNYRLLPVLGMLTLLAGCGTSQSTAQAPVVVTQVVTQVTTRVVTQVQTQIVVATPTQEPVTPAPMNTPEPTAVPEPTLIPTLEPTPMPEPLASGEVYAKIIRTIRVYEGPDEKNYEVVATASPGIDVQVLYRGGQWFQVSGVVDKEERKGWVYRDWIDIAPDVAERIPTYPDALPILVGKISQTVRNGKRFWSGRVLNVGAVPAKDVQVEISLTGFAAGGQTNADQQASFIAGKDLEPGQVANFQVATRLLGGDEATYNAQVLWSQK